MRNKLFLASGWLAITAPATAQTPTNQAPQDPPSTTTAENGAAKQDPKRQRVVVTAQKQGAQSVADVPRAVTAIGKKQIRDAGLTSIEEAARYVPNTLVTGFSARRLSFPYIRGVGSGLGDQAVTTFVDDVPQLSVSSTNLTFAGLERIEVLRGPSSVLWGRNTIGGAVNLVTQAPSWRAGGEFRAMLGNYGQQRYYVRATGPIAEDQLAVSIDASYEERDGFTDNTGTGNDLDYRESNFVRGQFLWTPTEKDTVRFTVYNEETRDGGFVLSEIGGLRSNPWQLNQNFDGSTERDILSGSIVWKHSGNKVDFTSITSAQRWDIDEASDFDFSFFQPFLDDAVRRYTNEEETYVYQEFRVGSAPDAELDAGKKDGVKWLIGTSAFYSDAKREASTDFRPGSSSFPGIPADGINRAYGTFYGWSASLYGQTTFVFKNGFEATAALRYDYENREARLNNTFAGFPVPGGARNEDRSFERVLPRGSLAYRCCDDFKTYFSAARGFKAGGFNLTSPVGSESYGTETSWTYEVGAKSQWLDDRVTANAAVFYVDWDDMQLSQFDPLAGGFISNAGESTSHGIELELTAAVCDDLTVFGTAGYLETEFGNATNQDGSVRGKNLPFAPKMTFGAGGQYTRELANEMNVFARLDWFHTGEFSFDASDRETERYNLTNLRLGWTRKNVRIEGFVNNLFDEEYIAIAFDANAGPGATYVGQNGAPLTYGVQMSVTF